MDKTREVLAVVNFLTESAVAWREVFATLTSLGLARLDLVVCDGLTGIEDSVAAALPGCQMQLCVVHLGRTLHQK